MAGKKSIPEWKEIFKRTDKDNSGSLDVAEVKAMLKNGNSNLTESEFKNVFELFDGPSGDQKVTLEEFENGLRKIEEFIEEVKCIFDKYDADKSGCLDKNELKKVIQESDQKFTESEICEILKEADRSGDGKISFEEFICAFT